MFTGSFIAGVISQLGYSHVIWLPDSLLGQWEADLATSDRFQLIRVCREGEAWAIAAGLILGGQKPLVMMQTTGLFESGDALRNVVFDLQLPVTAIIGARSWLNEQSNDSAKRFTLPIIDAWGLDYQMIERVEQQDVLMSALQSYHDENRPGLVLIAEGRM